MSIFFFFNDTATTEIYTLSLHDALPILARYGDDLRHLQQVFEPVRELIRGGDRRRQHVDRIGRRRGVGHQVEQGRHRLGLRIESVAPLFDLMSDPSTTPYTIDEGAGIRSNRVATDSVFGSLRLSGLKSKRQCGRRARQPAAITTVRATTRRRRRSRNSSIAPAPT